MPKKDEHKHEHGDCGCGCGCDGGNVADGDIEDIVELEDDEGKTVKFRHIATVDEGKDWFVLFSPVENTPDITTDEVVIFKLDTDEAGADVFSPVEDEALLQRVYDRYVAYENEGDEDDCCCGDGEDEEGHGGGCGGCKGCK